MNGAFNRGRLPTWQAYADEHGLVLHGRGKWLSLLCDFHDDGEPSLRVNTESGGWVCMSCGVKGGDVLAHFMLLTGLDFREAAQALGAWDASKERHTERAPRTLSAGDAMQVVVAELLISIVVISDIRKGLIPSDTDWQRFLQGAGRIEALAMEYRA